MTDLHQDMEQLNASELKVKVKKFLTFSTTSLSIVVLPKSILASETMKTNKKSHSRMRFNDVGS